MFSRNAMRAHCHRCEHEVEGAFAHPRLRKVAFVYLLLIVPFIPLLPIIAADYVVMIPSLMLYMLGLGPVFAVIRDPPTCNECGALLPKAPLPALRAPTRALPGRTGHVTQPIARADTIPPRP
jgi:hypothetical protein